MKYFPLLLFIVLFLAFAVPAQTNQDSSCPTLSAKSGESTKFNEIVYFSAKVDAKGKELKLKYNWFVSSGEIFEGQGTPTIAVKVSDDSGLIATVEVEGFPEGCPSNASEATPIICIFPTKILFDEFSIQPPQIDKARLDELINILQKNPNAVAFIIEYFKKNTPKTIINRKIQKIMDYLVNQRKLEKERFKILTDLKTNKISTRFWIVPPGAEEPVP